jgi:hypothetical protein
MRPKEIIERCGMLGIYEQRRIEDDYIEIVFYNREADEWNKVFIDIFGPPIKPAGVKSTEEYLRLTEAYGGIYTNQTMYKKDFGEYIVIVMLWPWQDDIHTTLKIALLKK